MNVIAHDAAGFFFKEDPWKENINIQRWYTVWVKIL